MGRSDTAPVTVSGLLRSDPAQTGLQAFCNFAATIASASPSRQQYEGEKIGQQPQ
jgi:hypothetical protein